MRNPNPRRNDDNGNMDEGGGGERRKSYPRRKVCRLCAEHIDMVDYKQSQIIKTFCTDTGKMLSRRITGACAKHQRHVGEGNSAVRTGIPVSPENAPDPAHRRRHHFPH